MDSSQRSKSAEKNASRKLDYKQAECEGMFGYGNGRAGRDYCSSVCPVARECWAKTADNALYYCSPEVANRWANLFAPTLDRREASRKMIEQGMPDPGLEMTWRNTRKGVRDRFAGTSQAYREAKGGTWLYEGRVIGYYPLQT